MSCGGCCSRPDGTPRSGPSWGSSAEVVVLRGAVAVGAAGAAASASSSELPQPVSSASPATADSAVLAIIGVRPLLRGRTPGRPSRFCDGHKGCGSNRPRENGWRRVTQPQFEGLAEQSGRYPAAVLTVAHGGPSFCELAAPRVGDVDLKRRRTSVVHGRAADDLGLPAPEGRVPAEPHLPVAGCSTGRRLRSARTGLPARDAAPRPRWSSRRGPR